MPSRVATRARRLRLVSDGRGHSIADLTGATNAAPAGFPAADTAAFGDTTSDATLGLGTAGRFTSSDQFWAPLNTSNAEVFYEPAAPVQTTICVAYQAGTATTTAAGLYSTTVVYTAVPV